MAVLAGNQRIDDLSRSVGISVNSATSLSLVVPNAMPSGPIRVATAGGTSAAFGLSITGITAAATSGVPANGAQLSANPGQVITLNGTGLDTSTDVVFRVTDTSGNFSDLIVKPSTVIAGGTQAQVRVPPNAASGSLRVVGDLNGTDVALQILPVITDVQVQSVSADGSTAQVLISGLGFVEGGNSEYRFGSTTMLDAGVNAGPSVGGRSDAVLGFIVNGTVTITVPLSAAAFGAISVRTAGGVSASYSVSVASIVAVALSGTPADGTQASANAGQAVTLNGTGLSTATDVLLRYVDISATLQMVRLSPIAAAADGTSATLVIPAYANGAFTLQIFGSASQPLLQIVPTLSGFDVSGGLLRLYGSGLVEAAGRYAFTGARLEDNQANSGADVTYSANFGNQNGGVNFNTTALPSHGPGDVTVTTAGGTSAPLVLNTIRVEVTGTGLGDVAVDASGNLWVSDQGNPGKLLRIDAASGQVLETITLTTDYGTPYLFNNAGLQVLSSAMMLGAASVPAGSLLVFNGSASPDRVIAVDPASGAVLATLTLGTNYDLTAGLYDPASGHLFVTETNFAGNHLVEIDPATGAQLATFTVPFSVSIFAGLAIDPTSGNFWLGTYSSRWELVEITRSGVEVRRVDLRSQGVNDNEISGLAFAPDGALLVASTQGVVYRVGLS
jgi:hypothetical protein